MDFKLKLGVFIVILHIITYTNSANIPLRPVFEQSVESGQYLENPLEGLTPDLLKQRARSHVQNQQMRYNSEKNRMQRAQARRFQEVGVETMDSYIKAHRAQQEQYQRDLERKFIKDVTALAKAQNVTRTQVIKIEKPKDKIETTPKINRTIVATSKNDSAVRTKRMEAFIPNRKRFVQKPPRGVIYASFPPHFNQQQNKNFKHFASEEFGSSFGKYPQLESASFKVPPSHADDVSSLTSSALQYPSQEQQFSQINVYSQNEDVESSLAALIGKDPNAQIEGLNQLLQQSNANHKLTNEDLRNTNVNLKSSSLDVPREYYDNYEPPNIYVTPEYSYPQGGYQTYQHVRDHTPITENVQDVADTRRPIKIITEHIPFVTERPIALTSSTNYYKLEVASQYKEIPSVSTHYSPDPAYTSYSSGYDDVSIVAKNKLKDTNNNNRNLQNRFKPKIKTETKKPNTEQGSDSSEDVDPSVYVLTTTKPNVFRGNLKFGDRIVKRTKPKDSVIQQIKRNKRQVAYRDRNLTPDHSRSINRFASNTTRNQFVKTKLKTTLINSYVKTESDTSNFPANDIRNLTNRVNCSECFKSNGESEFYYYDNTNSTDSQMDDDFPSYDDLAFNGTGLPVSFNASDMSVIQVNGTNITAENPHFEALRYRIVRMPKLYRLLNGKKTRVLYPNAKRFQRYLIQRPVKDYIPRYAAGIEYGNRGIGSQFENLYEPDDDYVADGPEDEYYDDSEGPEYEEAEETFTRNRYENILDRPPYSQYASGYSNYNEDYIQIETPSYQNRNNRFNTYRNPGHGTRGREKYRYASDYNQNQNYISDDIYNDYTRNFRGRYRIPQQGHIFDYDYTQSDPGPQFISDPEGDEYIDSAESFDVPFDQNQQKYNSLNKDFIDSYGTYHSTSSGKKKPQEPSNYYVENYNQYLSKPGQNGHGTYDEYEARPKPVNVFNIIRTEGPKKRQKFNGHEENGGVIHIDSLNVFPHGQQAWSPPKKRPHGLYGIPRRPIKHRRKRPSKWRGPRLRSRKNTYSRKNHMKQVQKNIYKLENIFRRI